MHNVILTLITFAAYAALTVVFWRANARGAGDSLSRGAMGHMVLLPLALHGYLLTLDIFAGGGVNLKIGRAHV